MEKLIKVFNEAKAHLLSLNIQGISIVLENDSIILFAGKKEIGSSIRIYNSKTFSKFLYCYGNFQNEIKESKILPKLKHDIQKLKEAYVSNKHKSPLMQFIQERSKELNITKDEGIVKLDKSFKNKVNVNQLDSDDYNSLLQNNINNYQKKQKEHIEALKSKEKKIFEDKVNKFINNIKKYYREHLFNSSKNGVPLVSFGFKNKIYDKTKGEELLNKLKDFKSYNDLLTQVNLDYLGYSFEVKKTSNHDMYFEDENDYSAFYLEFSIRIKKIN